MIQGPIELNCHGNLMIFASTQSHPQQFEPCTALIEKVLSDSSGRCEYALHVKALIARQKGVCKACG